MDEMENLSKKIIKNESYNTTGVNSKIIFNINEKIAYNDLSLIPNTNIVFEYSVINNNYLCDKPEFNIYAYGNSYNSLINDIKNQIYFAWKEYACESDEKLNDKALVLKKLLKRCFKESLI